MAGVKSAWVNRGPKRGSGGLVTKEQIREASPHTKDTTPIVTAENRTGPTWKDRDDARKAAKEASLLSDSIKNVSTHADKAHDRAATAHREASVLLHQAGLPALAKKHESLATHHASVAESARASTHTITDRSGNPVKVTVPGRDDGRLARAAEGAKSAAKSKPIVSHTGSAPPDNQAEKRGYAGGGTSKFAHDLTAYANKHGTVEAHHNAADRHVDAAAASLDPEVHRAHLELASKHNDAAMQIAEKAGHKEQFNHAVMRASVSKYSLMHEARRRGDKQAALTHERAALEIGTKEKSGAAAEFKQSLGDFDAAHPRDENGRFTSK